MFELNEDQILLRNSVSALCARFPSAYWRELDEARKYPTEFVRELTNGGFLSALIPEEFGGAGLDLVSASIILETINHSGGNAAACHAQMYTMGPILHYGTFEQKARYLPSIAKGELRLQAFAVTEPDAGSETTKIRTQANRSRNGYIVNGEKVFISRVQESDLMLLLARTTPLAQCSKKTDGLSIFLIDLREAQGIDVKPIRTMMNHSSNAVSFKDVFLPEETLIGEEGKGFSYILDAMNPERILIASECIGDGRWFIEKAARYSADRIVFGRPIGANQGVQFPIAHAHAFLESASLVRYQAAELYDRKSGCGPEANMAKLLASEAAWEAANACLDCHGGYGFSADFDIERKFRETRLYITAPINNNLVLAYLAEKVLGLPRSY